MLHVHGDGQMEPAIAHIESAARLARLAEDYEMLGVALLSLGTQRLVRGQIEQAEAAWQEAVDLFRRQDNRPRVQDAVHLLAMLCLGAGQFDRALAFLDEAYAANEALGNATETFAIVTTQNAVHLIRGEYGRALAALAPAREMDKNRIIPWIRIAVHQQSAWLYYELGDYNAAQEQCCQALACPNGGRPGLHAPELAVLTLIHIARGEWSQAAHAAAQGFAIFDREGMLYPEWWEALPFPLAQGELALAQGDVAQAAACAEYLLEKFETQRLRHLLPGVLFFRARIALAQGDKAAARIHLQQAQALSDEMGAHREVWAMCRALSRLEAERGNESASARLRERACAEVTFIADHAGTPELREIFLARTDVQTIEATAP